MRNIVVLFALATIVPALAAPLPRSTPEAQGVRSDAIRSFVDTAEDSIDALHSFMLLRHGHVVAEGWWHPYNAHNPHQLYSLSKSFTATAVGFAVDEGLLSLDDRIVDLFPGAAPDSVSDNLSRMRLRDLLRMNSGHMQEPWSGDGTWAENFLAAEVPLKPGTHFLYNTMGTYMAGAAVQRRAGMRLLDYLTPRLFAPLGIEGATWETNDAGHDVGGWGLMIRTEDVARFGQLYLQDGVWQGERLLPEGWVAEATTLQTSNGSDPASDWDQGYGYQFWRCRHGAYRGDGAFGQFCIVLPEQDAVLAITSGVRDMQAVLDVVWATLLPGMVDGPLRAVETTPLRERLRTLALPVQEGAGSSPRAGELFGRRFELEANDRDLAAVVVEEDDEGVAVVFTDGAGVETRLAAAHGRWRLGHSAFGDGDMQPVAASAAWVDDGTFVVRAYAYHTPYAHSLTFRPGPQLRLEVSQNVGFGPTEWDPLLARAVP